MNVRKRKMKVKLFEYNLQNTLQLYAHLMKKGAKDRSKP